MVFQLFRKPQLNNQPSDLKTVNYKVTANLINNRTLAYDFPWIAIIKEVAPSIAMLLLLLMLLLEDLEDLVLSNPETKMITEYTNTKLLTALIECLKECRINEFLRLLIWQKFLKNDNGNFRTIRTLTSNQTRLDRKKADTMYSRGIQGIKLNNIPICEVPGSGTTETTSIKTTRWCWWFKFISYEVYY